MTDRIITKTCTKCGENLPASEFHKRKDSADGLRGQCKDCHKACRKAWEEAHSKEIAERKRAYYKANREERLAYQKFYQQTNREQYLEYQKEYREANREKRNEQKKVYYKDNPEIVKAARHRRRALKKNAEGDHNSAQIRARFAVHGDSCIYCASTSDLHVDHTKPLAKGGSNWPANLAPACATCNKSKGSRWGADLLRWIEQNCTVERTKKILGFVLHSGA